MIIFYKFIQGGKEEIFKVPKIKNNTPTKSNDCKLVMNKFRLVIRFVTVRGVKFQNDLPSHVVGATHLNRFMIKLNEFMDGISSMNSWMNSWFNNQHVIHK